MKIGIDMGGSHVAIGIVNENGKIIEKFEKDIKTVGDQAKAEISTYIIEIISKIKENHNIEKNWNRITRNAKRWCINKSYKSKDKRI